MTLTEEQKKDIAEKAKRFEDTKGTNEPPKEK